MEWPGLGRPKYGTIGVTASAALKIIICMARVSNIHKFCVYSEVIFHSSVLFEFCCSIESLVPGCCCCCCCLFLWVCPCDVIVLFAVRRMNSNNINAEPMWRRYIWSNRSPYREAVRT